MNEYDITDIINELPLDLRVEIVVSDIINSGYDVTDIFIQPQGLFKRRFQKDISTAEVIEFNNYQQAVFVNTPREGIYDMLPQVIFHNPPAKNSSAFKSVNTMIDDYKQRVQEEKEARKFFSIYEMEFYRQRVANAMHEGNLLDSISYSMNDAELLSYWRLPHIFSNRQKGILFYLLPVFHKIRGALGYMQEIYRLILKQQVFITQSQSMQTLNYNSEAQGLGQIKLADNSILGNSYPYYYPAITVSIENLMQDELYDYLPGARNIQIVEKLNEYFMPVFCEAEIKVQGITKVWKLNREGKSESRLGYSAVL
jgi:hypothetical protein